MRMLRNNILVKKLSKEQVGKIITPDSVTDDWYRGKVVAVGEGMFMPDGGRIASEIEVGDIIVFPPSQYSDRYPTITVDGEECIIMNEQNIWGVEE